MTATTIVLLLLLSLALAAAILVRAGLRTAPNVGSLGAMSDHWLAAHNASQQASFF